MDIWVKIIYCEFTVLEHKFKRWFCTLKTSFKRSFERFHVYKKNPTQIWYDKFNLPKKKKDYNNVFLEDGKILKVGRSPEVPWSLPHLPPLTAFFSWGRNILFQIWNRGGICTLCAMAAHASVWIWKVVKFYKTYCLSNLWLPYLPLWTKTKLAALVTSMFISLVLKDMLLWSHL